MKRFFPIALPLLVLASSSLASAEEESPRLEPAGYHTHDGFYLNLALGAGGARSAESHTGQGLPEGAGSASIGGFSLAGQLLIGGTPLPGFVVGGGSVGHDILGPSRTSAGPSRGLREYSFGVLGPFATWYPDPHGGFHVFALAGVGNVHVYPDQYGSITIWGPGAALGIGHDFWVGADWSIGVLARATYVHAATGLESRSPTNPDLSGTDLRASEHALGGAFLFTATYH